MRTLTPYIMALAFGALGGFSLWWWGSPYAALVPESTARKDATPTSSTQADAETPPDGQLALEYADAVRLGNCDIVIELTWWMQERLKHVRLHTQDEESVRDARASLCSKLQSRPPEGNQLAPEGIEDKYVFAPDAKISVAAVDEGRVDLAKPVEKRVWLEVEYPSKTRALRDMDGSAVRALLAGVNVSKDGYILKASVLGNSELDRNSFRYTWDEMGG